MSRFLTPEAVNSARSKYGAGTVIIISRTVRRVSGRPICTHRRLERVHRGLSTVYRTSPLTGLRAYRQNLVFVSVDLDRNIVSPFKYCDFRAVCCRIAGPEKVLRAAASFICCPNVLQVLTRRDCAALHTREPSG
jgi:hypothetical protein